MADDARATLVPPWVRHPEIPRYSIGWRMGYGESYLDAWLQVAHTLDTAALVTYFESYAPIPIEWVDTVAMALDLPHRDPITGATVDEPEDLSGERIAHFGLFDVAAWRAYVGR
jgi:hypothetical protein